MRWRKEGGKINRLSDLAMIVDADAYIHNHTHLPATMKKDFFRVDTSNSKVAKVTRLFVNTAFALDYGGYGDIQAYSPSSKDNPVIILDGHKKQQKLFYNAIVPAATLGMTAFLMQGGNDLAHSHTVTDSDKHFSIDPVTREIILPEPFKPCLFLSSIQFAQLIVPYQTAKGAR